MSLNTARNTPELQSEARAFRAGLRAGLSLPPVMVLIAMIGFGSLASSQGLSLFATVLSAGGIYGLPGQVAMLELYATGASTLAILIGVSMANMRFLPMSIVLMPMFDTTGHFYRWRYLVVQLMSINSWSYIQQVAPDIPRATRMAFFTGFGFMCFSGGLVGAVLGWVLAANMPFEITVTLIFLNPAYFIFLFCSHRSRSVIYSLMIGAILGPLLFQWSPDWGLPVCGVIAGTLGFMINRFHSRLKSRRATL